jgi:hypothetical protein
MMRRQYRPRCKAGHAPSAKSCYSDALSSTSIHSPIIVRFRGRFGCFGINSSYRRTSAYIRDWKQAPGIDAPLPRVYCSSGATSSSYLRLTASALPR